jgi:NAD+ diphosphatase
VGPLPYVLAAEHPAWLPTHDRAAVLREDPAGVEVLWNRPDARAIVVGSSRVVVTSDGDPIQLTTTQVPVGDRIFLGLREGHPRFAVRAESIEAVPGAAAALAREVAVSVEPATAAEVLQAIAVANWHDTHGHCPRCGEPTVPVRGGYARRCEADESLHFPRIDPAVIVLVVDEPDSRPGDPSGRCLLARARRWQPRRMSTVAGFVEPAESIEQAVRREVAEEVAVDVADVTCVGSQPWPFPASLMLACYARAATTGLRPDGEEIAEARWFTREELLAAAQTGQVVLPTGLSVARRLIEGWAGRELPGEGFFRPA